MLHFIPNDKLFRFRESFIANFDLQIFQNDQHVKHRDIYIFLENKTIRFSLDFFSKSTLYTRSFARLSPHTRDHANLRRPQQLYADVKMTRTFFPTSYPRPRLPYTYKIYRYVQYLPERFTIYIYNTLFYISFFQVTTAFEFQISRAISPLVYIISI